MLECRLQEKLLSPETRELTPDVDFLESFAGVLGCNWPSLAASLSLSCDEIGEVRKDWRTQQEQVFDLLKLWASKLGAHT